VSQRPPTAAGVARRQSGPAAFLGRRTTSILETIVALLAVSVCACRTVPTEGRVGAEPAQVTVEPEQAGNASPGGLDQQTVRTETDRILAEVARARNLEVTGPVNVDVIDKAGIRAFARETLYEHMTREELLLLGRIEASFGVIPAGADPEQVLLDLLEDGVLGLYDPKTKTLLIGDFVPKPMLSMVVGHEIAHGLQDMYVDLQALQKPLRHRSDAESARTFVLEGEAQAAYLSWVSGDDGLHAIDDAVLDAMSNQNLDMMGDVSPYPILARSLQMPYADGTATILRLARTKGWDAVSALYDDLPTTTEQMLHLDKLLSREPAIDVRIDAAPIARALGLTKVWHDDLGEAALLSMLAETERSTAARRAADGWGGDAYVVFDDPANPLPTPVIVGLVTWDTQRDAEEFEASFRKYLQPDAATAARGHEGIDGSLLQRRGRHVLFALRVPERIEPDTLAGAAWASITIDATPAASPHGSGR
jgi:hypothetical protein